MSSRADRLAQTSVCAVVVTFHPQPDVLDNLRQLRPQVDRMVVVDNGSSALEFAPFHALSAELRFTILENRANLGIAAALNTGIRWAQLQQSEWVALFDQDSTAEPGLVAAMLAAYSTRPDRARIAIVAPRYLDRRSALEMPLDRAPTGEVLVVRTSGSLMPLRVVAEIGLFLEDFIIDQVDYEYCLRLRARGYRILACPAATLTHSLGERRRHSVLGLFPIVTTHHNARRRYYITRNRVRLIQLYWRKYPRYCLDLLNLTVKDTIKILLVERPKYTKIKNTFAGLRDAMLHRMGKTVEL